jgi:ribosomal protein S18 acetylase RimI-like enzyme
MIAIDLKDEGVTHSDTKLSFEAVQEHSAKIQRFVTDEERGAFICEDETRSKSIGLIMYSIVNIDSVQPWPTIFHELDRSLFQEDGRFVEIFQLWVKACYRRQGIATGLKTKVEEAAMGRGVNTIYTHTEADNTHVIALNEKMGYRTVRSGPIWDDIIRVSLIKQLL